MSGEKATLLATDPPYLVDYQGGNHPQSSVNKPDVKDKHWDDYVDPETSVAFFADFLRIALQHCVERVPVYQWHATPRQVLVEEAWKANGLLVHQTIIWAKARGVLTHSHYLWSHEPCFYSWPGAHAGQIARRASAPWDIDQQGQAGSTRLRSRWNLRAADPLPHPPQRGRARTVSAAARQIIATERRPALLAMGCRPRSSTRR